MESEKVKARYSEKRQEVQEYMNFLVDSIVEKYGEVNQSFIVSLDLLALNLEVLFKSVDDMKENGLKKTDKYHGEQKSSSMQAFFNAQNYIHKLIASFGFTPAAKSKIRENTDKQDVQKFLEELTK